MSIQEQVIEFHCAFDHPILERPGVPSDARVRLRARLVIEEAIELLESLIDADDAGGSAMAAIAKSREDLMFVIDHAHVKVDLVAAADALADIDYVVEGSRLELGINGTRIAREVHRSNMAKKGGGKREGGKTTKPAGWTPPDIAGELAKQREMPMLYGLAGELECLSGEDNWPQGEGE